MATEILTRRALAAYVRSEYDLREPSLKRCGPEIHDGLPYVVLRNADSVLAVYRVNTRGELYRLKRWPSTITPQQGER